MEKIKYKPDVTKMMKALKDIYKVFKEHDLNIVEAKTVAQTASDTAEVGLFMTKEELL